MQNKKSIIFFGDYDYTYPREKILKRGLEKNNIKVIECKIKNSRCLMGWKKIIYLAPVYVFLLIKFIILKKSDGSLFVPRNNHLLLPLAKFLSVFYNYKLIYDAFDPLYFTAEMKGKNILRQKLLYYIEKFSLRLPNYLLVETGAFASLYSKTFSIPKERFVSIPVGADEEKFYPKETERKQSKFTALYWGGFHPHHGVETIIRAAEKLKDYKDIEFMLVGKGMEYQKMVNLSEKLGLNNVVFKGRVSDDVLVESIASSDVCLGIFSNHKKALCSITNKVCEAMAMGKAVVTEKSEGTHLMVDGKEILKVRPEDPIDLSRKIVKLSANNEIRENLGKNGNRHFIKNLSEKSIGKRIAMILER